MYPFAISDRIESSVADLERICQNLPEDALAVHHLGVKPDTDSSIPQFDDVTDESAAASTRKNRYIDNFSNQVISCEIVYLNNFGGLCHPINEIIDLSHG